MLSVVRKLSLEVCALRGSGVEVRSLKILLRQRNWFKVAPCLDYSGEGGDVGTDVRDRDAFNLRLNDLAFGGVVVDEDEAVYAQVQLAPYSKNVLVLGPPVGLEAGDMFELQDRV